jgi:Cytochrome c
MIDSGSKGAGPGPNKVASDGPAKHASKLSERAWTWLLIGIGLLVALCSLLWLGPQTRPGPTDAPVQPSAPVSLKQLTPAMVPLATGDEPLPQLFKQAGCPVCHSIPGIGDAQGRVGPELVLGLTGPQRLHDPTYRGTAKTVREYIIESILSPGTYIVPGYPALAMPRWYGQKLSAGALEKIAAYLEQQTDSAPPGPGTTP